jgi:hypothetical protein
MKYAKLAGFKLYASMPVFKDGKYDPKKYAPYDGKDKKPIFLHYTKKPLTKSGEHPKDTYWSQYDLKRDDPILIQVVKELGKEANGSCAELEIVEIPDGINWEIDEYDGMERVEEAHRSWS